MMWSRRAWGVILAAVVLVAGCGSFEEEPLERVSIGFLRAQYEGFPRLLSENSVIEGEVISSDRYGAFSHQLVIQDPTGGITISIDHPALHTLYAVGDSVSVSLRGLTLGGYGGGVRLGAEPEGDWEVGRLSLAEWREHCSFRGPTESVACRQRRVGTLAADDMGTLVVVEGVRVAEVGGVWPEANKVESVAVVDTQNPQDTLCLRLAGHREVGRIALPEGEVDVVGVVEYFGGNYQITLLSPDGFLERE
jgi:hypothetical protein